MSDTKPKTKRGPKKPSGTEKTHLFDDPRNVKRALYGLYTICGIFLLLDFAVARHGAHPWESMFGFHAVYGFVACVLLVLLAKQLRKLVMRKEDFYDDY